jgi:hypothetical protein
VFGWLMSACAPLMLWAGAMPDSAAYFFQHGGLM